MLILCRVLRVSRSGFYAWLRRKPSHRDLENERLRPKIAEAFKRGRGTYESPRVEKDLVDQGYEICRRRVARLMRGLGLKGVFPRKFRRTTDSNHSKEIAPNVLFRDFTAKKPNEKRVTDITYIWTGEGWLYLAAVMDLYSRRIVGWSTADHMETSLCLAALSMALKSRTNVRGLMHHSDRGSQYASDEYRKALASTGIECSMSRRGNCWANVSYPLAQTVVPDSESSSYFRDRMTSLGHLANGLIPKLGGVSLMTHGTPSDSSMLAILVSTISGGSPLRWIGSFETA